jgi:hypothetical protein
MKWRVMLELVGPGRIHQRAGGGDFADPTIARCASWIGRDARYAGYHSERWCRWSKIARRSRQPWSHSSCIGLVSYQSALTPTLSWAGIPLIMHDLAGIRRVGVSADWYHLAMRVQHVAQAATGWPDTTETDRQAGTRLTETIERIRWRLWHGQVRRALDLIAETAITVDGTAGDMSAAAAAARKVARLLGISRFMCPDSPTSSSTTRRPPT